MKSIAACGLSEGPEKKASETLNAEFLKQFDWLDSALSPEESLTLHQLLSGYEDLFLKRPHDMVRTQVATHMIPTGSARPVHQLPRRVLHTV